MKNTVIFVLSFTSNIRRGRQTLAPQEAGVFRLYGKQAICTRRARSVMGRATRAERLVFDSGRGKSLFVCPKNVKHHHAHRNLFAERTATPFNFKFAQEICLASEEDKHAFKGFKGIRQGCFSTSKAHRAASKEDASGLPVASAAIPPRRLFSTQNLLIGLPCSGVRV